MWYLTSFKSNFTRLINNWAVRLGCQKKKKNIPINYCNKKIFQLMIYYKKFLYPVIIPARFIDKGAVMYLREA